MQAEYGEEMMYKITIRNLKPGQVWPIINALPGNLTAEVAADGPVEIIEPTKSGRMKGETYLSLTGKEATKGSMRAKVLVTMEKLEVKHGVGSVTRNMLKEQLVKKDLDTQILYQLIREGYLKKQ